MDTVRAMRRRLLQAAAAAVLPLPPAILAQSRPAPEPSAARVAVCFGSGSLHGHAHVGAIRAFDALGLQPDVIAGTSVGAIAGALWAAGLSADEIEAIANDDSWREAGGWHLPRLGLWKLNGLRDLVDRSVGGRAIEQLPIRFAAVATDIDRGNAVVLDRGPVGQAVAASSSVPIRYEPVTIDGHRLVDGALSAPIPVDAARRLGADFVIAIDVAYRPYEEAIDGLTDVAFQMMHILVNRLIDEQIRRADFPIRLDVHAVMRDNGGIPALVRAGETAVRKAWPKIQSALARR